MAGTLPEPFLTWFATRGWVPRPHQIQMLEAARAGESVLLIAPTGGGKTLAGFLPSLIELAGDPRPGLHTLYVSPLKALATDIARNLTRPVQDMRLPITIEARTGDTPANRRSRQRASPPHILLTTPESLAVLLSLPDASDIFSSLACVVIDEVHALAGTKRGDQLALGVGRLATLAPQVRRVGLSATVAHPAAIQAYTGASRRIDVADGAPPELSITIPEGRLSWSGHMGLEAAPQVMQRIRAAGMTIVFVNTRAQAELMFQALWKLNDPTLPIALHHGSLEVEQRRKVEAAMAAGSLRAVVATSSLDLGIDWGGVDQVIQVGAPKGVSRLLQRVGRANHRMDEASRAILVPANRFEVLECEAAILGIAARELDGDPPRPGGLDVLAQHLLALACSAPFLPDDIYREVIATAPYAELSRADFDDVLRFVEDGGYALRAYDQWKKLFRDSEGRMHVRNARTAAALRMNIGTIVEAPLLKVRLVGKRRFGPSLGELEEYFANMLRPGDTFMFAGRLLRFIRIHETAVECMEGGDGDPMVPAYAGGRLPLTTNLADRVRGLLQSPEKWELFPDQVRDWLRLQRGVSRLPGRNDLLIETFPRGDRWYLVAYCFEGRNAHQTLGMLVTKRMERAGFAPLGFVATDYVLGVWSANQPLNVAALFNEDMLGDDLEAWMAESSMLKRTFRNVAVIAGLIQRNLPGAEKNRRQVTVNSDLIYEVLRRHQPDHILLRATRADAASGLTDVGRIAGMLARVKGHIVHMVLSRVSPLAVPVLLDIGRESVRTDADEETLLAEAEAIIGEATGGAEPQWVPGGSPSQHGSPVDRCADHPGGLASPDGASNPAERSVFMNGAPIHMLGERLMLDPMGALFWPETRLLAVSDLHLEKGSSFARRGMLLPPWDTHATLDRLTLLLRRWAPATVVALGDSFHDASGSTRLPPTEQKRLIAMTEAHRFIWVQGNHDPTPPAGLGGDWVEEFPAGPMMFRHQAIVVNDPAEVVGHHHPKATVQARSGTVSRPCFVFDGHRLMMPAFGAYTGGLDVRDPAINRLFPRGGRVFLLGKDRLFSFEIGRGNAMLERDRTGRHAGGGQSRC